MSVLFKAAALLALCAAPAGAAAANWSPLAEIGQRADGIWQSQGYGRILVLRRGTPALYHLAGPYCYRDPENAANDDSFRLAAIVSPSRIALAASPDQTHYTYDRIAALPRACTLPRRWSRQAIVQVVAATFADLYPGFGQRGRERRKLTDMLATGGPIPTDTALYTRLTHALDTLDDGHVGLQAQFAGVDHVFEGGEAPTIRAARADAALGTDPVEREKTWSRGYRDGIVALLDGGGHHVANRRILWGRIGQVGYLNIVTMGAFAGHGPPDDTAALDTVLDEAMTAFRGLSGVIVDVTNNRGGYDAVSLHIAGRFADRARLAFTKRAVGAPGRFQSFAVTPSRRTRYLGPVTLLTSDITVSAGETFALEMRALPNVRHVGARTRGALSDQLAKPLPNGWTLTLPAETYRDPEGRSFEGVGIEPAETDPPFAPDHRTAVARIAERMQRVSRNIP